jgi:predicted SAM-dependent methyltransferase
VTWQREAPQGGEQRKTRWRAVPYTRGEGLDLGCGAERIWDNKHVIGVDSGKDVAMFNTAVNAQVCCDVTDLKMFASRSQDFVFSSHVLEHIIWPKVPGTLREWCRVVRKGGHVVLYLPAHGLYPDPGEEGSNPDHQFAVTYDCIIKAMETVPRDWDLVEFRECSENDEYSFFFAFKMTSE